MPQWMSKIPSATTKPQHTQINKYINIKTKLTKQKTHCCIFACCLNVSMRGGDVRIFLHHHLDPLLFSFALNIKGKMTELRRKFFSRMQNKNTSLILFWKIHRALKIFYVKYFSYIGKAHISQWKVLQLKYLIEEKRYHFSLTEI